MARKFWKHVVRLTTFQIAPIGCRLLHCTWWKEYSDEYFTGPINHGTLKHQGIAAKT